MTAIAVAVTDDKPGVRQALAHRYGGIVCQIGFTDFLTRRPAEKKRKSLYKNDHVELFNWNTTVMFSVLFFSHS